MILLWNHKPVTAAVVKKKAAKEHRTECVAHLMCDTLRWRNILKVLLSYRMCCTLTTCVVFLRYVSLTQFGECAVARIHWWIIHDISIKTPYLFTLRSFSLSFPYTYVYPWARQWRRLSYPTVSISSSSRFTLVCSTCFTGHNGAWKCLFC